MQGLDRILRILKVLALADREGLRAAEVARLIDLSMPTTLRLLEALGSEGLVTASPGRRFTLGPSLVVLGRSASRNFAIDKLARPSLEWLAQETGDTAYLSVRDGTRSVCIDRVLGPFPIQTTTINVGDVRPLGVGAGSLALLAALPADEIEAILRHNEHRMGRYRAVTADRLRREIPEVAAHGYAYTQSHVLDGIDALGVVVCDPFENPVAAVTTAAIASRFEGGRRGSTIAATCEAARRIKADLASRQAPDTLSRPRAGHPRPEPRAP